MGKKKLDKSTVSYTRANIRNSSTPIVGNPVGVVGLDESSDLPGLGLRGCPSLCGFPVGDPIVGDNHTITD